MHLYHYCLLRPFQSNGANYQSGTYMLEDEMKTNQDYSDFVNRLEEDLNLDSGSFVINSLSKIYSPENNSK